MSRMLISNASVTWRYHVSERISAAEEIGLLYHTDKLNLEQAFTVYPDKIEASLMAKAMPYNSINELIAVQKNDSGNWVERIECIEEIAQLIHDLCIDKKQVFMFCEAGYSKIGDKYLENFDHALLAGYPILFADILKSPISETAKVLRAGRSTRIIGILKSDVSEVKNVNGCTEFFFCDALDGDSVIICPASAV